MRWPLRGVMFGAADKEDSPFGQCTPGNGSVYVVCIDRDELFECAVGAGATVVRGLTDEDYGARVLGPRPEGNLCSFGTYAGEGQPDPRAPAPTITTGAKR